MPLNNNPVKLFYCKKCKRLQKSISYFFRKKKIKAFCLYCGLLLPEKKVKNLKKFCSECKIRLNHNNKKGLCRSCMNWKKYKSENEKLCD